MHACVSLQLAVESSGRFQSLSAISGASSEPTRRETTLGLGTGL